MLSFLWIYVISDRFQKLALIRLAESIFLPKVNKNWGSTWYGLHVWDTVGNGVFSGGPFNLSMCACMNAWKFASLVKNVTQEKTCACTHPCMNTPFWWMSAFMWKTSLMRACLSNSSQGTWVPQPAGSWPPKPPLLAQQNLGDPIGNQSHPVKEVRLPSNMGS